MTSRGVGPWALAAGLVAGSWFALRQPECQRTERTAADAIRGLRTPAADPVVAVATDLGSVYGLAGAALALGLARRRTAATDVLLSGALAWALAQSCKPLANRPRPYDDGEIERLVAIPAGTSWPSGHSAVATAMGLAIGSHGGLAARTLGTALTGFVGTSRVYVGVHHPTDVIAGVGVGIVSHRLGRGLRRRLLRQR